MASRESILRMSGHALEQFREKAVGLHEHRPVKIYLSTVHWINSRFNESDRSLDVCAVYDPKRIVFDTIDLQFEGETQRHFFLCDIGHEKNAAEVLTKLPKTFSKLLEALDGVCVGKEVIRNDPWWSTKPIGDAKSANQESLAKWCSLLYWLSTCYGSANQCAKAFFTILESTKPSLTEGERETMQLDGMESTRVQDNEFQEWFKLGADLEWVPAKTISRLEMNGKTLEEWGQGCQKNGLSSPTAIACSLPSDIIQASRLAIDYLLQNETKPAKRQAKSQDDIELATQSSKSIKPATRRKTLLSRLLDALCSHHRCFAERKDRNFQAIGSSALEKILEVEQPTACKAMKAFMKYEFDLQSEAAKIAKFELQWDFSEPRKWYEKQCDTGQISESIKRCIDLCSFEEQAGRLKGDAKEKAEREFEKRRASVIESCARKLIEALGKTGGMGVRNVRRLSE